MKMMAVMMIYNHHHHHDQKTEVEELALNDEAGAIWRWVEERLEKEGNE